MDTHPVPSQAPLHTQPPKPALSFPLSSLIELDRAAAQAFNPWHAEFHLPRVQGRGALLDHQLLLGGLALLLSRLHPVHGRARYPATRRVAMRLHRSVELSDPQRAHLVGAELQAALHECERALDPGSLLVLRKLAAMVQEQEAQAAQLDVATRHDFTFSDFMAESALMQHSPHSEKVSTGR
jgi:hypothetical protein